MSEVELPAVGEDGYVSSPAISPMSRGLSQVLFNYLPERTFDYDRGACIGKVFELRVEEVKGIDVERLCAAIAAYVRRWNGRIADFDVRKPHLLLFGRPTRVLFNLFPLTFQCGHCDCVKSFEDEGAFEHAGGAGRCSFCGKGDRFEQIYHILVHECGYMAGLQPRRCQNCKSQAFMALDLRGSQQARDFRWLCKKCGLTAGPVQRPCPECKPLETPHSNGGATKRANMRVIPHRANSAYYPHNITVLNLPTKETAALRDHPNRDQVLATAVIQERYDLDALLRDIGGVDGAQKLDDDTGSLLAGLADSERAEILRALEKIQSLQKQKSRETKTAMALSAAALGEDGWLQALEFVNLHTLRRVGPDELRRHIEMRHPGRGVLVDRFRDLGNRVGISSLELIHDFPVVTAVFGYTRVSHEPESSVGDDSVETQFRGFNSLMTGPREQMRRRPVFVDDSSTEALLFKLSPSRVARWLRMRGHDLPVESTTRDSAAREWLLSAAVDVDAFVTLAEMPEVARDVFVLAHTYSHLIIKALARLSGIDRTGLAEYLFPRMASFVVYNTKAGVNLGGLHTVHAELQEELLYTLREDVLLQTCVYDPLCGVEQDASCHACTHLPEMCCKHYNRGLSRKILFNPVSAGSERGFLSVA